MRLAPHAPEAHLALAQAYDRLDQPREAARPTRRCSDCTALPAVHRRLAELYRTRLGDPVKAAAHLRQAEEAAPRQSGP